MTSVFIGGSRRISRMNAELAHRFNNIIQKELLVLIGDANGFDRLAQAYFAKNHYPSVLIYCTAGICRNNVGNWPLHVVDYQGRDRGLEFYTAKDDAMLQDANFGLFGWDGKRREHYETFVRWPNKGNRRRSTSLPSRSSSLSANQRMCHPYRPTWVPVLRSRTTFSPTLGERPA